MADQNEHFQRFLEDQEAAARAYHRDFDEAVRTGRLYRGLLPVAQHGAWLAARAAGFQGNPGPFPTQPIANRNEVAEELQHRASPAYFLEIFNSFLAGCPAGTLPVYRPNPPPNEDAAIFPSYVRDRLKIDFMHDGLAWEAMVQITGHLRDGRRDTIIQYHIPVDGAIFLQRIPGQASSVKGRHNGLFFPVGMGNNVPQEFFDHARQFFGSTPQELIYYNPHTNRLDLTYRLTAGGGQRKVDLKICFDPGWPTEPFNEDEWFAALNQNRRQQAEAP